MWWYRFSLLEKDKHIQGTDDVKTSLFELTAKISICINTAHMMAKVSILQRSFVNITGLDVQPVQFSPELMLRHDAVTKLLAYGMAAFTESCAAVGWKDYGSVKSQ